MAVVKSSRLSGVADGTVLTTATAGTGDSVFNAVTGTNTVSGGRIVTPATTAAVTYRWTGLALTTWNVRVYVMVNSGATVAAVPIIAGDSLWKVSLTGSGQFALRDGSNVARSYSAAFSLGTEYCISVAGSDSSTSLTWSILKVSDGSTFLAATTVTGIVSSGGTNFSAITFGRDSSTLAGPLSLSRHWIGDIQVLRGLDSTLTAVASQSDNVTRVDMTSSTPGSDGSLAYSISPVTNTFEPVEGIFYITHTTASQTFTITVSEASSGQTVTKTITVPAAQATRQRAFNGTSWV
jgi:hypothetical protein